MEDFFSRSEAVLGADTMSRLAHVRVILFGVGGVGSWCAEALIRTGLTHLTIVDDDTVQPSNINRQLPAIRTTIGCPKVEVLRERLLSINPDAEIIALQQRYEPAGKCISHEAKPFDFQLAGYDIVIDAIDSVPNKADLLITSTKAGCKVYSSMGAALRLDPTMIRVSAFDRVSGDGLARALRQRFKQMGQWPSHSIRCVWSAEVPITAKQQKNEEVKVKGSLMPVTASFGCHLAACVLQSLISPPPSLEHKE